MTFKIAKTMFLVFIYLASFRTADAESMFYDGDIIIDSIIAYVRIEAEADIFMEYTLTNRGEEEESVDLAFFQTPVTLWFGDDEVVNPVTFAPYEEKTLTLSFTADIRGENTKAFTLNPTLTLDDKLSSERVESIRVDMILPQGVKNIISSNKNNYRTSMNESGRLLYSWDSKDTYPTNIDILWSTLDVVLSVSKAASPQRITEQDQAITVEVIIENMGDREVSNIVLVDDFLPTDFEAVEPLQELFIPEGDESDPRLFWMKEIEQLQPGESKVFHYTVRYIGDVSTIVVISLEPCTVMVDGNLISVSNEVRMRKMVGASLAEEAPEVIEELPEGPSILFVILVAVGVMAGMAMIVAGFVIAKRRR